MLETVKREISAKVVVVAFIILTVWWLALQFMNLPNESHENQLWAAVYGLIGLWGGLWGIAISRKWGGLQSVMGKSILLFSVGLLFQEIGQLSYSFYIYYLDIEVPYPSIGDFFFYATIPLYTAAVLYLAKASGVKVSLQSFRNKLQAIAIPGGMLAFSYFMFLQEYSFDMSEPLKTTLDFVVPLGQAIYISLAILTFTLTKGILGGLMKTKVLLILFALVVQYVADWTFLYQASREIWYAGGINDYMFLCAYFIMTIALIQLKTVSNNLSSE